LIFWFFFDEGFIQIGYKVSRLYTLEGIHLGKKYPIQDVAREGKFPFFDSNQENPQIRYAFQKLVIAH
jgi:hypothetical protein